MWIEWNGGDCPVAHETMVDLKFSNGETVVGTPNFSAGVWDWHHTDDDYDIVGYRHAKPE